MANKRGVRKDTVYVTVAFNLNHQSHVEAYDNLKAVRAYFREAYPQENWDSDSALIRAVFYNLGAFFNEKPLSSPSDADVKQAINEVAEYVGTLSKSLSVQLSTIQHEIQALKSIGVSKPIDGSPTSGGFGFDGHFSVTRFEDEDDE